MQGNNNHKQKIIELLLNSEKAKNIYEIKNNNNSISLTDRNFLKKKKNLSNKNLISFEESKVRNKLLLKNKRRKSISNLSKIKDELLSINKNENMNSTLTFSKNKNNKYKDMILSENNINENNDIVNTKRGYISLKKIKKNIIRNDRERRNSIKLNIVQKYICSNNKEINKEDNHSFSNVKRKNNKKLNHTEIKNILQLKNKITNTNLKINRENKNDILNLTKEENISIIDDKKFSSEKYPKRINNSSLNIKIKEALISNKIINKDKILNSSISSLLGIQKSYRKIHNLIGDMKRNYAISLGQRKFIFFRKSKKNKAISLIDDKNNYNTFRQKSIGQSVKNYYYRKKIEGYSALVNPLHNTYINRQRTVKIIKSVKI